MLVIHDILQYMDETFDAEKDVRGKILYIESIRDPERLLRHAKSLIAKGCGIAAIKSGSTQSGARATSHHTGSAAFDDKRADELFREAGIVRCYSRQELVAMGCLFSLPRIEGNRFAIITQAGGLGARNAQSGSRRNRAPLPDESHQQEVPQVSCSLRAYACSQRYSSCAQ